MTIDIKELRPAVEAAGLNAISMQEVLELLGRLELAESRQATYRKAFEISENTIRDLTEKVIPNIREKLEAAEKAKDDWLYANVPGGWIDALRLECDYLRAELETERMRLAACGVAALGYFEDCCDEYKSASLTDVLRLRTELDALKVQAPVAWRFKYRFKDIGETGAYEYHSHEFACVAMLPCGEPLYALPGAKGEGK